VTLEDLYAGSTKRVAIRQPDPLRPDLSRRKEVDVPLNGGMRDGQTVRLCGVVDSAPDAPPADVVFLLRERRHPVYARRGDDLAVEVRIGLGEAIGGYEREIRRLDGTTIVIGSPSSVGGRVVVLEEEEEKEEEEEEVARVDDVPSALPSRQEEGEEGKSNDDDDVVDDAAAAPTTAMPGRTAKTAAASHDHLPPSMIRTGDVHVLRGHGMPRGTSGGHDHRYGDLYVQYVVEMPGGGSSSSAPPPAAAAAGGRTANADNLLPEERVELARLLNKLEGRSSSSRGDDHPSSGRGRGRGRGVAGKDDGATAVHRLEVASASDFGRPAAAPTSAPGGDHRDHDEHLRMDDDDDGREVGGDDAGGDIGDFFQRAFAGAGRGPSPPGFRYFSSSTGAFGGGGGFGYGGRRHGGGGEEEDHKVECNQM